jgi:phosphomannomutase
MAGGGPGNRERRAVSELAGHFADYKIVKTKVAIGGATREGIVSAMADAFPGGDLELIDGAKLVWPDRWIHVRMSGTEPVIRVIAEASSAENADEMVERAVLAVTAVARGAEQCAE